MIHNPSDAKLSALMSRAKQLYIAVHGAIREVPFMYCKQAYTVVRYGAFLHVYDAGNRKMGVRRL